MKLEINVREKKNMNTGRLNNMLLNDQEITEEIKEAIKITQKQMIMKTQ